MLTRPAPVKAIFEIEFTDLTSSVSVLAIDNVLNDANPDPNIIRFVGTVGSFSIDATVATTNSPGTGALASVGMSSGKVTNNATTPHSLQIFTTSTDFVAPTAPVVVNSSASMTVNGLNPAAVTMHFTSYVDGTNAPFGTGVTTPTVVLVVPPGGSSAGEAAPTPVAALGTPYSVSNRAIYDFAGSTVLLPSPPNPNSFIDGSSGTTNVRPPSIIPGPGGLALALAGLPFLGLSWLRRRGKQA